MRIYLDNCCFNRPYDDQSQIRIRLETEAKLKIQSGIQGGHFELVWSYIMEAENMANPFQERKKAISSWSQYAKVVIQQNDEIINKAKQLIEIGLRSKDALHLSCAISAGCDYFLTTDDKILNKMIEELSLIDPIGFIKEVYL